MTTLVDANGAPPTIPRGASVTLVFNVVEEGTIDPKSLVGATEATLAIVRHKSATALDLQLALGSGISHDGSGGVVTAAFTKEQTEALPYGTRWCELWITDNAGDRELVGQGDCIVNDTVAELL